MTLRYRLSITTALILISCALNSHAAEMTASPLLFQEERPVEMTLTSDFPFGSYHSKPKPEKLPKFPGELSYEWHGERVTHAIKIQARGNGRLSHCRFAPVKLHFGKRDAGALFSGISGDMKLVTHCDEPKHNPSTVERLNAIVLKEYLMYKMLEALDLPAFKVRLAKVRYENSKGETIANHFAFFIERNENFMARNPEIAVLANDKYLETLWQKLQAEHPNDLEAVAQRMMTNLKNPAEYVANTIGQLLILNDDWAGSMLSGNTKVFIRHDGKASRVHYDFDLSFLVEKFEGRGSRMGFVLPPTVEGDLKWLRRFCNEDDEFEGDFKAEQKRTHCLPAIEKLLSRATRVRSSVADFPYLEEAQKKEILRRIDVYFQALKAFSTAPE